MGSSFERKNNVLEIADSVEERIAFNFSSYKVAIESHPSTNMTDISRLINIAINQPKLGTIVAKQNSQD